MGLLSNLYTPHNPGLMDFLLGGQDRVDSLRDYQLTAPQRAAQRDAQTSIYKAISQGFNPQDLTGPAPGAATAAPASDTNDPYGDIVTAAQGLQRPQATPVAGPAVRRPQSAYERLRMPLAGLSLLSGKYEDANTILAPQIDTVNGVAFDKRTVQPGTRIGTSLSNVNDTLVDTQDPGNANRFIPEAPAKGAEPLYNQSGQQMGWRMMDGSIQAIQQTAQAQEAGTQAAQLPYVGPRAAAQAAGTSPYDFVTVQGPNGEPVTMSKSLAAGGSFVGQTPIQAMINADAANAEINLPQMQARAKQSIRIIDDLAKGPGLAQRTGMAGLLPVIPGSEGADFEAKLKQLSGLGFLQVYQELKGGGAITNIEGDKAEMALSTINDKKQSVKARTQALQDYKGIIQAGLDRAESRSASHPANAAIPATGVAGVLSQAIPGLRVTSGYRTPEHNREVKGVDGSLHTRGEGEALDLQLPPGTNPETVRNILVAKGVKPTEFLTYPDGHLHVGWGAKGGSSSSPKSAPAKSPAGSVPPSEAISFLKANPALASAFDQKYGAGQSKKFLGSR